MKPFLAILLALVMLASLCGCQRNADDGEVAVFYYTYSDTYISGVRAAMDKLLKDGGVRYNDYDANGNQTTQTEQITTAIAKGASALIVNVVDTGSNDAAQHIVEQARSAGIPLIFFNRSVDESVVKSYDKCVFVGTDYEMAGHMQGELIGDYLLKNYDAVDLNKDGKISYVLFKGQEGNMEAIARTRFAVEDCDKKLTAAGKSALSFYDPSNQNRYLVDQDGNWSSAAATNYMGTILAQYSEANKNMVELVIANNDEMALGAISALQSAGYNKGGNSRAIPVFGVDATVAAQNAIRDGAMVGTIKQDANGMAGAMFTILENFKKELSAFAGIEDDIVQDDWRVNIPYSAYTGEQK